MRAGIVERTRLTTASDDGRPHAGPQSSNAGSGFADGVVGTRA